MAEITPIIEEPEGRILHRLTAYMDGDAYPEHTRLTQYDTTLPILAVSLQCSGRPYEVPTAGTVSVRMRKPDGHHVYNPALGLSSDRTTAYIVITSQMTAAAGNAELAIEVMADGGIAASGILAMAVISNPVPESAYDSTDEMRSITELAAQVEQAATKLEQYKAAAETAAASAAQASAGAESARDDAETAARTATSQAASATGSASAASQSAASAQSYCEQSREVAEDFADIKRLAEFVEIDDGTLKLDGGLEANGRVTATGTISTESAIFAALGIVAGNNYGFYVRNAAGDQLKLFSLTSGDVCTVGNSSCATNILGNTITANGRRLPEVQHGTQSCQCSVANQVETYNITFGTAFSGVPSISLTPETTAPQNAAVSVRNVTKTGFTLYFRYASTTAVPVEWTAIY